MRKEQEEAIEYVQKQIDYYKEQIKFIEAVDSDYYDEEYELYKNRVKQFETVLSMLKENSAEIKKKNTELAEKNAEIERLNRQIDLITEFLGERDLGYYKNETGGEILGIMRKYNKEDWKEYFERKATNNG